ncbi:MAG: DUF2892 domain-containing protein [Reyranella sp.]|nr:DUF2892 domain-containing protein [Reyranella sp.]
MNPLCCSFLRDAYPWCCSFLLAVAALMPLAGWPLWAVLAGGAGLLVSALAGFCPACALAGRRLS